MKMIIAVIKPFKIDEVRDALTAAGFPSITVDEVKGYGRSRSDTTHPPEFAISFLPKLKITIVVEDNEVERAEQAILAKARTGKAGDGKIWVVPVERAWSIRTGEDLMASKTDVE